MPTTTPQPITGFAAVLILFMFAVVVALALMAVSVFLGPKRPTDAKEMPYESGMTPVGGTRDRFGVHYYMVAMLFIVFDVDIIFMYPWAVIYARELGRFGLIEMGIFFLILVVGYIYVWKKGALDWD